MSQNSPRTRASVPAPSKKNLGEGTDPRPAPAEGGSSRRLSPARRHERPSQRPSTSEPVLPRRRPPNRFRVRRVCRDDRLRSVGPSPESRPPAMAALCIDIPLSRGGRGCRNHGRLAQAEAPPRLMPVERVAADYLKALSTEDSPTIKTTRHRRRAAGDPFGIAA